MEFFKRQTRINFLGFRKQAFQLSLVLCILSITSLLMKGLNWGLDFSGGLQFQLSFSQQVNIPQVRQQLERAGYPGAVVQAYGGSRDIMVNLRLPSYIKESSNLEPMIKLFPDALVKQVNYVGPQVGKEWLLNGIAAVFIALLGIMVYVWLRFGYWFSVGAAVALLHDPILILGIFSLFQIEFNLTTLAAVLAIIGYSLNDVMVIYDRIRENFHESRTLSPVETVNLSLNQTLSRTIITSGVTLLVVLPLFLFSAGGLIHNFALALVIGIAIGTYSSIYIAGALAIMLGFKKNAELASSTELQNDRK